MKSAIVSCLKTNRTVLIFCSFTSWKCLSLHMFSRCFVTCILDMWFKFKLIINYYSYYFLVPNTIIIIQLEYEVIIFPKFFSDVVPVFLLLTLNIRLNAYSQVWDSLATESHLKLMKNALNFSLKSLFVLNIFKFLSWFFGHVEERLDQKDQVDFKNLWRHKLENKQWQWIFCSISQ